MARETGPAQEAEAGESKDRILAAAERLFAEQGYAATSIREIAQGAGVNRALIYYYFKDKRDLYWAVIQEGVGQMSRMMAKASLRGKTVRAKIEAFIGGYYQLLLQRQDTLRIILRETTGSGEEMGLPIKESLGKTLAQLQAIIEEGIVSGELRVHDPEMTAYSLVGMLNVFVTRRLVTGRIPPMRRVVQHTLDLFGAGAFVAAPAGPT
jgi:TetR/AcrR family transcriptional regulator